MIAPIDLHHQGADRSIGCYLLDTDDGPALFDCGPSTTIDALKAGLAELTTSVVGDAEAAAELARAAARVARRLAELNAGGGANGV